MDTGMFPANIFTGMFSATVSLVIVMVSGFLVTGVFRALVILYMYHSRYVYLSLLRSLVR